MFSALTSFAVTFLVRLAGDVWSRWRAEEDTKALGRAEAVAEGQAAAAAAAAEARRIEVATTRAHQADPTDAAFDTDFKRP